jgi:AraC-like DNA-binding protein
MELAGVPRYGMDRARAVWRAPAAARQNTSMVDHQTLLRLCRARDRLRAANNEVANDTKLLIADVAREARISPYHFIRLFHSVFGETPHQFRIQARLERAKLLLAAGGHSVTEVCMEVGFESLGSFSSLFAQRVGAPPSAYRERFRRIVRVPARFRHVFYPACFSLMAGNAGAAIFEKHVHANLAD